MLAGALQLDGARPQQRAAATAAAVAITALQQPQLAAPVLLEAAGAVHHVSPSSSSSSTAAALDAVSELSMALSSEADAAHAAAVATVVLRYLMDHFWWTLVTELDQSYYSQALSALHSNTLDEGRTWHWRRAKTNYSPNQGRSSAGLARPASCLGSSSSSLSDMLVLPYRIAATLY
jgi:hypothetical protein